MNSNEKTTQSVEAHVHDFFNYTTTHGFGRLAAARSTSWRLFWIVMLLGAHCAFYFHTYAIFKEYMAKPIRTRVSMRLGKSIAFPTVTICNRNQLRKNKVPLEMINEISKITNATTRAARPRNVTRTTQSQSGLPRPELKHPDQVEWELLRHLYNKYDVNELVQYGHQLDYMVLDCSFNGEDCTSGLSDETFTWRHIWGEDVGNCYMFNRALDDNARNIEPYRSTLPGSTNGLRLLLNVEQYEYLDDVSPYAGLRVVIKTQGQMPFPQLHGLDVVPGLSTSIELRKHEISRLDPFRNNSCENTGKLETSSVFWLYNMTYSKMACKMSCLIMMQTERCKCAQFHLPTGKEYGFCDFNNSTVTGCLDDVYGLFLDGRCEAACPPPCSESYFTTTISSSKWPSNNYKERLNKSLKTHYNMSMSEEDIRDNLMELHIYFADLDYVHVEETLKYEFQDIISNVGGQLGMWIGVSALSIAEVIELIILVVHFLINKKKQSAVSVQRINVTGHEQM